jgi:hypothetical protein
MMARSTRSKQRPDTLMQDRYLPDRRKPLATRGRTIHWVTKADIKGHRWCRFIAAVDYIRHGYIITA